MMQRAYQRMEEENYGASFYKLLGTGAKGGFSWKPNFSVYGFLAVWNNKGSAEHFVKQSELFGDYKLRSSEQITYYLKPLQSHGQWSNENPFKSLDENRQGGKVAVLTRATIKYNKMFSFWRRVSGASDSLNDFQGRKFSIGIGELPWIQQATFSVWESMDQMKDYAYKNPVHRKIIQMTREKNWYKEELFARFLPIHVEGSWNGNKVLL